MVDVLPGVDRRALAVDLRERALAVENTNSTASHATPRLLLYLRGIPETVRLLTGRVSQQEISALVLTPVHDRLLTMANWADTQRTLTEP